MAFAPYQTSLNESITQAQQEAEQQSAQRAQQQAESEGRSVSETFRGPEFQEELARSRNLSGRFPEEIMQFLEPLTVPMQRSSARGRANLMDSFRRSGGLKSSFAGQRFGEFERDASFNEMLAMVEGAGRFFNPLASLQQNRLAVAGAPLSRSESENRSSSSGFSSGESSGFSSGSSSGSGAGASFGFPPPIPPIDLAPPPAPTSFNPTSAGAPRAPGSGVYYNPATGTSEGGIPGIYQQPGTQNFRSTQGPGSVYQPPYNPDLDFAEGF